MHIRTTRLLKSLSHGATTSTQLETLLDDPAWLDDWSGLLSMRGAANQMAARPTAMAAVAASPTAMAAVAASPTAMAAVAASPTAMAAVAASPTAMAAVRASPLVVEASTSGTASSNSTIHLSMATANATNIQVIPGATGRAIVVAAKLSGAGVGPAAPLVGFTGGTTGWEWIGDNEVLVAASATIPTTPGAVSFAGTSAGGRAYTIYYIPV